MDSSSSIQQYVVPATESTSARIGDGLAEVGRVQSDVGVFFGCAIALIIIIIGLASGQVGGVLVGLLIGGISYGMYYETHHSKGFAEFEGASAGLDLLTRGRL